MASPTDSARQGTNITTAATSHAINVGSPLAGTLLIVFVRFAAAPGTVTFTGYTSIADDSSDASDDTTRVFYRWADGAEGATDTLTTVNSVKLGAICWEITGATNPADSAPRISTVAVGTTAANSANPDSAAPVPAPADTLYLALAGGDGETVAYTAAPTNYSNLATANSGTGGAAATNCFMGGASRALTESSSENPGAFTHGAHTTGWTAFTVAIRAGAVKTLTPATETDAAQAQNIDKQRGITHAAGSDAAQAQNVDKTKAITTATEASAAQTVDLDKHVTLSPSAETEAAQALSIAGPISVDLTPAADTSIAQGLDKDKHVTIEPPDIPGEEWYYGAAAFGAGAYGGSAGPESATEAVALEVEKRVSISAAAETSAAQVLTFVKTIFKSLVAAVETEAARALTFTKTIVKSLIAGLTTDAAQALDADKHVTVSPATVNDAAQALSYFVFNGGYTLTSAMETSTAVPLTIRKVAPLAPGTEADAAQALAVAKRVTIAPATENNAAQALSIAGTFVMLDAIHSGRIADATQGSIDGMEQGVISDTVAGAMEEVLEEV